MDEAPRSGAAARLELYETMRQDAPYEEKVQRALDIGAGYLDVDNAHLTRIEPDADYWEAIVSTDPEDGQFPPGLTLDYQRTYCRQVLADDGAVALHDAPEQGWGDDPAFEAHGLHCYYGTPITVDGEVHGTLCFVSETPREQPFEEHERTFAELVARLVEQTLQHRRHSAEVTRRSNSITVLSRVLRHNLRNEMTVVRGYVGQLIDRLDGDPAVAADLFTQIDNVIALSDKARKLETVVSTQYDREPTPLSAVLEQATAVTDLEHPSADVTVTGDPEVTVDVMPSFELAMTELVDNAAKHATPDPTVTVTVEQSDESVTVRVADDGPGLPASEREVLAEGTETPLVHGSGLGLWMVYWIVTNHDGTIDATVDDGGTTVTVRVPRVPAADVRESESGVRPLQREQDRFEAVFEEAFDAMAIIDDDRRIVDANERAGELFDEPPERLLGRKPGGFAADRFDADAAWDRIRAEGHDEGHIPLEVDDGGERILEYAAVANIVPGQHLLVGRDITERRRRERELEATNRRLEAVVEGVDAAIFIKDTAGRYQLMNKKCRELLGVDADADVEGLTDDDVFPEPVAQEIRAADREVFDRGEAVEVEERIPTPAGTRTFLSRKSPLVDDGTVTGLCAVSTDVTEHLEREQALRQTTDTLDAVLGATRDPVIAVDEAGVVQVWNEAAEAVFGYAEAEAVGESVRSLDLQGGGERSSVGERVAQALDGETVTGREIAWTDSAGDRVRLRVSATPLRDADGSVSGVVAVMRRQE